MKILKQFNTRKLCTSCDLSKDDWTLKDGQLVELLKQARNLKLGPNKSIIVFEQANSYPNALVSREVVGHESLPSEFRLVDNKARSYLSFELSDRQHFSSHWAQQYDQFSKQAVSQGYDLDSEWEVEISYSVDQASSLGLKYSLNIYLKT